MPRNQIEMHNLSRTADHNVSPTRVYEKFPFFVGDKIKLDNTFQAHHHLMFKPTLKFEIVKLEIDLQASLASFDYQSQSVDNSAKPIDRFWHKELNLVNLCCNAIAKKLLESPTYYKNRNHTLPEELNSAIDQKLNEANQEIWHEKLSAYALRLS